MVTTFLLGFVVFMIGVLGVNRPGGCRQYDQEGCFTADNCGWMCVEDERCYCFPSSTTDWAPVNWMVTFAFLVMLASVGGCFLHIYSIQRVWHPYDAL
jgi:hypothetical protein